MRRSLDKQSIESAGGIYQYDNYDEVAMDTESETNSPGRWYLIFGSEYLLAFFLTEWFQILY